MPAPCSAALWRRYGVLNRKSAFAPVAAPDASVLILGSLPGDASLNAAQYYAHPRNAFWRLVGAVIGVPDLAAMAYELRLAAVQDQGIALWDTVASARRQGSLDSAIQDAAAADLAGLVARLPLLRAVAFNGAKSAATGGPLLAGSNLALITLPSSSPAHAALSLEGKREAWLALREFLRPRPCPSRAAPT